MIPAMQIANFLQRKKKKNFLDPTTDLNREKKLFFLVLLCLSQNLTFLKRDLKDHRFKNSSKYMTFKILEEKLFWHRAEIVHKKY